MVVQGERSPLAFRPAPVHHAMAYVCECGEKWFFARDEVNSKEARTLKCACGRMIVIEDGIVYGTGYPRSGSSKRTA